MKKLIYLPLTLLLVTTISYSQSPGGVSGSGTNEAWFDASQLTLNNNDAVSSWTDVSGNGNHATNTLARRPIYKTSQINGLPAVDFDGSNDRLRTNGIPNLDVNTITSFAVFSSSAAATGLIYRYCWQSGAGTNSNYIYGHYYNPTANTLNYLSKNSNGSNQVVSQGSYTGTATVTAQVWDGTTSLTGYYNGNISGTIAGGSANPSTNRGISLGANYYSNNGFLNFLLAEKITYSTVLSSAEINIVNNYLAAKYAVAIGNDLYAYEGSYGHELIGIGQESDGNNLSALGTCPLGMSVGSLSNGDYILAAHDDAGYAPDTNDVPLSGYARYDQVWRAGVTGSPGNITITMDVSEYGLGGNNTYKLLVDADGVFAAGATIHNGVYAAGTVTFSNIPLADGDYFTLANANSVVRSTGVTTDWHTTTTWDCSCIPAAGMTVFIRPAHTVDINGQNAASANLTVDGTLTFSGSDTLRIIGSLTNNGTFTAGSGAVLLDGTAAQTIGGTLAFNELIIDNAAGVTNTGTMSIAGSAFLDIISGTLATGNDLTFISGSGATGTAALANPSSGSISGDVTVQRYLYERGSGQDFGNSWYLLAPSVTGGDLEDWNQEFEMQGFPGTEWFPTISSVYYFDQNNIVTTKNEGYTVPGNTTDIMPNERGYEIWVGDDSYATGGRTIDITGTAALGSIPISAPHTVKLGVPDDDGWTLMANPYISPVLWSNVQKSANYDQAYRRRWDGVDVVLGNGYVLGVGEAFWVHSDPGGSTITFDPSDVNSTNEDNYNSKLVADNNLKLLLKSGDNINDETEVGFSAQALDIREKGVDAYKLKNPLSNRPRISTMIGNSDFHLNILSANTEKVIPIRIYNEQPSGVQKNYDLAIENVVNIIANNKVLVLEDRDMNTFTELTEDLLLPISIMDNVQNPRFFLHVKTPLNVTLENLSCEDQEIKGSAVVSHDEQGSFTYTWKDMNGNTIRQVTNSIGTDKVENLTAGSYQVEVAKKGTAYTATLELNDNSNITADFDLEIAEEHLGNGLIVTEGDRVKFYNLSENEAQYEWNFGDNTLSSSTEPEHIFFNEGIYNVQLTVTKGECQRTISKEINVLSRNNSPQTNQLDEIIVYNNNNGLFIQFNNSESDEFNVNIYNSLGQEVYNKNVQAGIEHRERVILNNADGVYLVTITNGESTKTEKIVITKE